MLSEPDRPADPESAGDAPSDIAPRGSLWGCQLRETTAAHVRAGNLTWQKASVVYAMCDFAELHNCVGLLDTTANWFGFGDIKVMFESTDGGYWVSLVDLLPITGLDWATLRGMFDSEYAECTPDVDVMTWPVGNEGHTGYLDLVTHSFALRAMLAGPWSREFMDNTMGLFRHAMVKSGLADKISPVVRIREDGTAEQTDMTFGEFMAAGDQMPTEDEAREAAFRGPVLP
jgi:hypothetical protein